MAQQQRRLAALARTSVLAFPSFDRTSGWKDSQEIEWDNGRSAALRIVSPQLLLLDSFPSQSKRPGPN